MGLKKIEHLLFRFRGMGMVERWNGNGRMVEQWNGGIEIR
jgi:hypothetical protein